MLLIKGPHFENPSRSSCGCCRQLQEGCNETKQQANVRRNVAPGCGVNLEGTAEGHSLLHFPKVLGSAQGT